jgi:lysozyme
MTINRKVVFATVRAGIGPLNEEMVEILDAALSEIEELDELREDEEDEEVVVQSMSHDGLIFLANLEGVVLTTYEDSKGILTIGVGHTAAAGPPRPTTGLKLTTAQAIDLFEKDIEKYAAAVRRALKKPVNQCQFDALCSFHYNTGAIARASLTDAINRGEYEKAATLFMRWVKPVEITGRRRKEQNLFKNCDYGDTSKVGVKNQHPGKTVMVPADKLFDDDKDKS